MANELVSKALLECEKNIEDLKKAHIAMKDVVNSMPASLSDESKALIRKAFDAVAHSLTMAECVKYRINRIELRQ